MRSERLIGLLVCHIFFVICLMGIVHTEPWLIAAEFVVCLLYIIDHRMRLEHLMRLDLGRLVPAVLHFLRNYFVMHVHIDFRLALRSPIERHVLHLDRLRMREPERR